MPFEIWGEFLRQVGTSILSEPLGDLNENGALDVGDVDALAQAITQILDDPEAQNRIGAACLKRAKATFNWDAIAPQYLAFFDEAIAAQC